MLIFSEHNFRQLSMYLLRKKMDECLDKKWFYENRIIMYRPVLLKNIRSNFTWIYRRLKWNQRNFYPLDKYYYTSGDTGFTLWKIKLHCCISSPPTSRFLLVISLLSQCCEMVHTALPPASTQLLRGCICSRNIFFT